MDIVWEDPPEEAVLRMRAGGAKYADFAIELRKYPEKWAVLPVEAPYATKESAQSAAQNIRRGITKAFAPKGTYEAVAHDLKIHVRYMPPKEPAAEGEEPVPDDETPAETAVRRSIAPKIRDWCKANSIEVADHGRLPRDIIDRYFAATGEERPDHLRVV